MNKNSLDWGLIAQNDFARTVFHKEIFEDDCYQKFFKVESGDVVVDVGASVGLFTYSILDVKPKQVYCLEPHPELYKTLNKNVGIEHNVKTFNLGLSSADGINYLCGLFDQNKAEMSNGNDGVMLETIAFDTLVKDNNITQIDFLKTDCEGAEYDLFSSKNLPWIKQNVKKIAGEFHLHDLKHKAKFRHFRETYLKEFTNYEVLAMDYYDIKYQLWFDDFIDYFSCIMIYIDNR